jgi:hypothetical protein
MSVPVIVESPDGCGYMVAPHSGIISRLISDGNIETYAWQKDTV